MAAFTPLDPADRHAFDARWRRIRADEDIVARTILVDGAVAGSISCWRDPELPGPEVTYWLGRAYWGRGIATEALALFVAELPPGPFYGRCAADNMGSRRVLETAGFEELGRDRGFANARGGEIEELLFVRR